MIVVSDIFLFLAKTLPPPPRPFSDSAPRVTPLEVSRLLLILLFCGILSADYNSGRSTIGGNENIWITVKKA